MLDSRSILVIIGLFILGALAVISAKAYESNIEQVTILSPWIGIPIVLIVFGLYVEHFSFVTYIISIGAVFLLFI
jgi:hypothetical protein